MIRANYFSIFSTNPVGRVFFHPTIATTDQRHQSTAASVVQSTRWNETVSHSRAPRVLWNGCSVGHVADSAERNSLSLSCTRGCLSLVFEV